MNTIDTTIEQFDMPTDINEMELEEFQDYLTEVLDKKYRDQTRASYEAEKAISSSVTAEGILPNDIIVQRSLNGSYKKIGDKNYVVR